MSHDVVKAIVVDIEGTTTDIAFVHKVLFPYARERMAAFIAEHGSEPEVRVEIDKVFDEVGRPLSDAEVVQQLIAWIDEDRKIAPLKAIQGMIWKDGFEAGDYLGHIYPDVPLVLGDWQDAGIELFVYSSGSVAAQKLIFGYSEFGDITDLFSGYFDTAVGHKREADAYRNIQSETGFAAGQMLFISDVAEELDAAREAGWQTMQLLRDGTEPNQTGHSTVSTFADIELLSAVS